MPTTTTVRLRPRALSAVATAGALMWAISGCGEVPAATTKPSAPAWKEPASYAYTLRSTEGERPLIGTFRVTVRDGKVVKAVGLDDSGRHVVDRTPQHIPTIADLLKEAETAREEGADKVDVSYAANGRPATLAIDWDENGIDDEAAYDLSDYEALG
ncbi:DUF6174 domain-containing protein [Streptomyces caniscabiei]|uniref:DUF6174 domain-containing protein n=1 Tax=Streptomyces caniscabiei TaxID=2746961 RepID=UPI0029BA416E|nr:DUF6174 domain-containing protein [Streptomyces caniscabiei]MDX2601922.1 DUF6174 domain-containing protein [Streptomyces caniscabiei]MDX2737357.1 DUF6174 domain-containing protein [Streptomyces caniscabiei]MDX2777801.1 DUF6174 domain-containing protein [Streptomyces caniscabiei]